MRVGFLSTPAPLASKIVVAKQVEDVHSNQLSQMLCSAFIERYDLDAHIEKIRALYRQKSALMLKTLDEYMPACVSYTRPQGGLFLWCTLSERIDMNDFVQRALTRFVAVVPGTAFNCDEKAPSQAFRVTYATPTEEQIVVGVKTLASLVQEMSD